MNSGVPNTVANKRKQQFQKACKEHGLRLTPQKSTIFEALAETNTHPTAQELYTAIQKHFPTLSFATVYKNLTLFTKKGLVQELDFGEGFKRYDAHLNEHHHIYHTSTKTVEDVILPNNTHIPLPAELSHIPLKKIHITYVV
ncbi:MAG: Fur family transcriptional regulator [Candidatus Peregrinibacteria bacterium]